MEISQLLNTGLDAETLAICVKLCESGVNPEALASVIQELRSETAAVQVLNVRLATTATFVTHLKVQPFTPKLGLVLRKLT